MLEEWKFDFKDKKLKALISFIIFSFIFFMN